MKFSFGGMAGGIVKLAFSATDAVQKGACSVAEAFVDDKETKKMIREKSDLISNAVQNVSKPVSKFTEEAIDTTIIVAGELTGKTAKTVCEICDASPETTQKAEQYGKIVGKAAAGYAIGALAVPSLISSAAVEGTAGASAITSGLAGLGAGAGMSGGMAVAEAIVAGTTLVGALTPEVEIDYSHLLENPNDNNDEHSDEQE